MKTVVMITPYFVPRRRVGSQRPYRFATHLESFGWKPVVYTIDTPGEELTKKEQEALRGVTVKYISPPFDRTTGIQEVQQDGTKYRVWAEWADWFAEWFDRQTPMDTWYFLFRASYGKILDQVRVADPALIWSTGDPWSGHWLGHKLSRDLHKPWIADFRDPWTLSGLNLRKRSAFSNWMDKKLEKKIVTSADKLIFTAKATEDLYRTHYKLDPVKTETIYNSFEAAGSDGFKSKKWDVKFDDSKLNLVFFGSFRRLSPVKPIAEAVAEMDHDYRTQLRIHAFGSLEKEDKLTLQNLGISDLFVLHEKVVPESAPAVFEKADLLLVSTSSERKSIIPAKLWEYLISGKPILSITPNTEIAEILEETGAGIHFLNDQKEEIAGVLTDSIKRKKKGEPALHTNRNPERISQYSAKQNTRKLAQIMDRLASDER